MTDKFTGASNNLGALEEWDAERVPSWDCHNRKEKKNLWLKGAGESETWASALHPVNLWAECRAGVAIQVSLLLWRGDAADTCDEAPTRAHSNERVGAWKAEGRQGAAICGEAQRDQPKNPQVVLPTARHGFQGWCKGSISWDREDRDKRKGATWLWVTCVSIRLLGKIWSQGWGILVTHLVVGKKNTTQYFVLFYYLFIYDSYNSFRAAQWCSG